MPVRPRPIAGLLRRSQVRHGHGISFVGKSYCWHRTGGESRRRARDARVAGSDLPYFDMSEAGFPRDSKYRGHLKGGTCREVGVRSSTTIITRERGIRFPGHVLDRSTARSTPWLRCELQSVFDSRLSSCSTGRRSALTRRSGAGRGSGWALPIATHGHAVSAGQGTVAAKRVEVGESSIPTVCA